MPDRIERLKKFIDNHILVWSSEPSLVPLAEVLKRDRTVLIGEIMSLEGKYSARDYADAARLFLLRYVLERVPARIDCEQFTIFREAETVEVILEDTYGVRQGAERDEVLIPHQAEALKILVKCISNRSKVTDNKNIVSFLRLFSRTCMNAPADQDRSMRLRSMLWFIYLAIEVVKIDSNTCQRGLEFLRTRLKKLLDSAIEGAIISEDRCSPSFEGGKWDRSIFGWMQGEDRREFVRKLRRQFNMENRTYHGNRFLLAEHRKCLLEQVLSRFC